MICPLGRSGTPLATLVLIMSACGGETRHTDIDDVALADASRADWVAYGRTSDQQRFSPLTQIDDSNVGGLAPAWYMDLPDDNGLVSTPLVVDGTLYFIGSMNRVRAVDAACGEAL